MPTYEYVCDDCGTFDAMRSFEQRNTQAVCPECGSGACERIFASAPRLAAMAGSTRKAHEINEKARHEPIRSKDYQAYKHPAGCSCCSSKPGLPKATRTTADGAKYAPSKRPWMISH
ncbi:zinc ribbon domain-containing protein [Lampropedia puyangensis]|uniref:Zinc ribbon domain-containing protein n=1 Tax=Lampropedia puyangensis TaxID=1330072 RepID=A0A4S8FB30_9BURK|nr:zinc ribbon domain-containing protein [Lampropedia puyangensis]THU04497.1 zinc ribbon domain-containing protein [Lampropedia puyangensis]